MTIERYLIGYRKNADDEVFRLPMSEEHFGKASGFLEYDPDDPDFIDAYALEPKEAEAIAEIVGAKIDGSAYDYFLQAFDDAPQKGRIRLRAGLPGE